MDLWRWFDHHGPVLGLLLVGVILGICLVVAILRKKRGGGYQETPGSYYRATVESSRGNARKTTDHLNRSEIPHPLDEDIMRQPEEREEFEESLR